jgi:hypothetical protein
MDKEIEVEVETPRGVSARVTSESREDFGCRVIATKTEVERGDHRSKTLKISADVDSREDFPVVLRVTVDGENEQLIRGQANGKIAGSVKLGDSGNDKGDSDERKGKGRDD